MGAIRVLPEAVASQVAAGEVVERPASVAKELLENSFDAGARWIRLEFEAGGVRRLRVADDGCGMDRDDALLCLERHATSKIRKVEDLAAVRTMGFRGEALPSIASVSRFRLVTCPHGAPEGTEVRVDGGRLLDVRSASCAPGTVVEVRDLFFNVPARRKFVRGEETESGHVAAVVQAFALAAPAVGVECRREGRLLLRAPPANGLEMRLLDLFGRAFLEKLVVVGPWEADGIKIEGFIGKPGEGRRDRLQQHVTVNGRPVVSSEISLALREAYGGLLPAGLHPICVLRVEMDPSLADCNAHPTKRVIRFAKPETLRRMVCEAAEQALRACRAASPPPVPKLSGERPLLRPAQVEIEQTGHHQPHPSIHHPAAPHGVSGHPPKMEGMEQAASRHRAGGFRYLGKLGAWYALFESPEGLVILDARSASERIQYERLARRIREGQAPSQRLLLPEVAELPPREHAWVVENLKALEAAGFLLETFGGLSVKIEAIPALAPEASAAKLLHEVASTLRAAGRAPRGGALREELAKTLCRKARPLELPAEALLEELLRCELPYANPFGQPTLIQFSFAELERKLGRSN